MEKRLFLAIGLSLMVVLLWSSTQPQPQRKPDQILTGEQTPDIVSTKEKPASLVVPSPPSDPLKLIQLKPEVSEERVETLESDMLVAEFSNFGASLKKVTIKQYDAILPIENIDTIAGHENLPFTMDIVTDNTISYSYMSDDFKIIKTFKVNESDYIIESKTEVRNLSNMSKLISVDAGGYVVEMSNLNDKENKNNFEMQRDKSLLEYVVNSENGIERKASAFKFTDKDKKFDSGKVFWSGFRDRYFCALVKPQYNTVGYDINPISESKLKVSVKSEEVSIQPQSSAIFDSLIYIGPEELSALKEYRMGFEKIKKYYRFGLFDGAAKIISSLMHWIHGIVPNWGLSIIIISVIIYFSMYPLTLKSMMSMRRMQTLQPMIAELKVKHKDNPQKMNKEMMGLYKEHKVNPLGGCLPMLLQMPVFIGLYQVLWRSVSFKGADFLWIKDLSQPDRLFLLPFKIPFLGNEFNLLPVIMIVVMYAQQKLSTKNIVITDPSQAAQQKMMTTIMPIFIGVIFYKFASGLTLYFTMFYIFSTLTQWKMSKMKKAV